MANTLLLAGCGKMGGALLTRWREALPHSERYIVIDPQAASLSQPGIAAFSTLETVPQDHAPDCIILAVKPQQLADLLPHYARRFGDRPLYLSVAAGKTLAFYAQHLGQQARVVRAMPNTPAMIGEGAIALAGNARITEMDRQQATRLMAVTGLVEWLEDESLLNAVTALSGCGPAYVFLFLESLVTAGIGLGLPPQLARQLALKTVQGSTALAAESMHDFRALRDQVASPGGSTEAALQVLLRDAAFKTLLGTAMQRAAERAEILSK